MANVLFMNILIGTSNPGLTLYAKWNHTPYESVWTAWCSTAPFDRSAGNKTASTKGEILNMYDQFAMTDGLDTANHSLHINFKIDGNGKVDFDIYLARIFA